MIKNNMKCRVELFYKDRTQAYKFFEIKQNNDGELCFLPALFNSTSVGNKGNHSTYHQDGYLNTTLKGYNGYCLQYKGPKLKPISQFKGVMQVMCLTKMAFEADLLKIKKMPEKYAQDVVITRNQLEEIPEPNINILLLEPNRKDILRNQQPYSLFLKGKHIVRCFDNFSPWVVLLIGSGVAN